ncbi:MAG: hypothetical protein COB78_04040 [Hyphomicrobiales bacterium]|nr:MAG: hypothetical protein COB78_04040 [Hyphomicrobiales bacterium]
MSKEKQYSSENGLAGLQALVERGDGSKKGLPPVERWEPDFCGDLDMVIKSDGTWFYMGTPIGRQALVKLFSTVLRKDEDGKTYLVTPVEKIGITVEDAHFVAVEMNVHEEDGESVLTFRTNVGDIVTVGPDNPLRFVIVPDNDGVKPYIRVRGRLEAVLARPVMYELIALGQEIEVNGQVMFAVQSKGEIYPIMAAETLAELSR